MQRRVFGPNMENRNLGEDCVTGNYIICIHHPITFYFGNKMEDHEINVTCSTHLGDCEITTTF
jgi:hypothetical protein